MGILHSASESEREDSKVTQPQEDQACTSILILNKGVGPKSSSLNEVTTASLRILGTEAMVADGEQGGGPLGHSSKCKLPEAFQQGWKVLN